MNLQTLSSREVASLLNVTETTVKRWTNTGNLLCTKTLGGHRKYSLQDVISFSEKESISVSGTLKAITQQSDNEIEYAILAKNYSTIAKIFLEKALQVDRKSMLSLLLYLVKHRIALATIIDEILRPSLVRMGELWSDGKLEINAEHRSTYAISDALIQISPELYRKPPNNHIAICACTEGELHEIGIRGIAYTLESEGWNVQFVGANTPFSSLEKLVKEIHPHLVCLSFTLMKKKAHFFEQMNTFGKFLKKNGVKFVVGGFYAGKYSEKDFSCDKILLSANDMLDYSKNVFQLKPGPKISSEHA